MQNAVYVKDSTVDTQTTHRSRFQIAMLTFKHQYDSFKVVSRTTLTFSVL